MSTLYNVKPRVPHTLSRVQVADDQDFNLISGPGSTPNAASDGSESPILSPLSRTSRYAKRSTAAQILSTSTLHLSDRQYYPREVVLPLENLVGAGDMQNSSAASALAADLPLGPKHSGAVHCVEFQPSEICPKKFIIFDRTHDRSQIMFHPTIGEKLSYAGLELNASCYGDNIDRKNANYKQKKISCLFNDNLNEIDALLSFDDEVEDSEEEEVSSANLHGDDGSRSLDSFSNNSSKSRKIKHPSSSSQKSSDCGGRYDEQKREKLQKMIQVLRGIVPGGDQMNTVAILDAAVRYLKSLKVEAQNLGVANLKNYA